MSYTMKELVELERIMSDAGNHLVGIGEEYAKIFKQIGHSIGMQLAHNAELRKKIQSDLTTRSVNETKFDSDVNKLAEQAPLLEKQQRNLAKEIMANEKLFKPADKAKLALAHKAQDALLDTVTNENRKNENFIKAARKEWIGKHRARTQPESESTETPKEHITTPKLRK